MGPPKGHDSASCRPDKALDRLEVSTLSWICLVYASGPGVSDVAGKVVLPVWCTVQQRLAAALHTGRGIDPIFRVILAHFRF